MKATMPKMPDAYDYCYEWNGPYGTRKFSTAYHNGRQHDATVPIYTADQLRARDAEVWALAMEQAAQAARDELMPKNERGDWTQYAHDMAGAANRTAAAIRALPMPEVGE